MMFDAFSIHFRDTLRNSEASKKIDNRLVPAFAGGSERASFFSQKDRTVRLGSDQARSLQTCDGAIDRDVSYTQTFGQVHDSRFTKFSNKIRYGFDVIFSNFIGVFAAGLIEVLSLSFADD